LVGLDSLAKYGVNKESYSKTLCTYLSRKVRATFFGIPVDLCKKKRKIRIGSSNRIMFRLIRAEFTGLHGAGFRQQQEQPFYMPDLELIVYSTIKKAPLLDIHFLDYEIMMTKVNEKKM
jgi:hypothetical protein